MQSQDRRPKSRDASAVVPSPNDRHREKTWEVVWFRSACQWRRALLLVALLLLLLLGLSQGEADLFLSFRSSLLLGACVCSLYIFFLGIWGKNAASVFVLALVVRLSACVVWYLVAPRVTEAGAFRVPMLLVYNDGFHYIGIAESLLDRGLGEVFGSPKIAVDKVYRIATLITTYKRFLGLQPIWVRLVGSIIGAVTVVFTVLSCRGVLSVKAQRWCAWVTCVGPQFVVTSLLPLKELYSFLAGSLCLYALWSLRRKPHRPLQELGLLLGALGVTWWVRWQLVWIVAPTACIQIVLSYTRESPARKALAVMAVLLVVVGFLTITTRGISEPWEAYQGIVGDASTLSASSHAFEWANRLRGPLRLIHVPILFANPPPFQLHRVIVPSGLDHLGWFRLTVKEMDTVQWWLLAPWLLIGVISLRTRAREHLLLAVPYLLLWVSSALANNGVNPPAARFRDTFLSFAVLISGLGIDANSDGKYNYVVRWVYLGALGIAVYMNVR